MSQTFTKLFSGLTESTVWVEPYPTRILWVSMLSWADQHGRVYGSLPGIARRAGINIDEAEAALVSFMSPDRHSRTSDNEGRRVEKIDGGWRLLNYSKYREMRDVESRREQNREAQKKHRERLAAGVLPVSTNVSTSADNKPGSAQAEAEAEEETSKPKPKGAGPRFALPEWVDEAVWKDYLAMRQKIRKPATDRAKELIIVRLGVMRAEQGQDPNAALLQSIERSWAGVFPVDAKKAKTKSLWDMSDGELLAYATSRGISISGLDRRQAIAKINDRVSA